MTQRNTLGRARLLAARARNQRARVGSQRWGGTPAWQNRRTGKPHEHNRAKARRQARISTDPNWPVVAGRV